MVQMCTRKGFSGGEVGLEGIQDGEKTSGSMGEKLLGVIKAH